MRDLEIVKQFWQQIKPACVPGHAAEVKLL